MDSVDTGVLLKKEVEHINCHTSKSLTRQRSIDFPNAGEAFQGLSKRNRPISRPRDVIATPAKSKGPHLGPACPPAAVRDGIVGKLSAAYAFFFFSWLLVRMSKSFYSPFFAYFTYVVWWVP